MVYSIYLRGPMFWQTTVQLRHLFKKKNAEFTSGSFKAQHNAIHYESYPKGTITFIFENWELFDRGLAYHRECALILRVWLTYSEKHNHAEHWQQGRDDHTEENWQFLWLPLLSRPLPGAAGVLLHGLPGRRWLRFGFIDACWEAIVEERSPLCHCEPCLCTSFTTSEYSEQLQSKVSPSLCSPSLTVLPTVFKMLVGVSNVFSAKLKPHWFLTGYLAT